jgi:hypothetical protein
MTPTRPVLRDSDQRRLVTDKRLGPGKFFSVAAQHNPYCGADFLWVQKPFQAFDRSLIKGSLEPTVSPFKDSTG